MAEIDIKFLDLCRKIYREGREYQDRSRGGEGSIVKRLQIPSYTLRHSFDEGFPAITNKKLFYKSVVGELIWFLRGDNDIEYLKDNGIKIWDKDAYNWYLSEGGVGSFEEFIKLGRGSVGQNYSTQWRDYNGDTDQILNLIRDMKKNIMSTRLKVAAWNPSEINKTALPPCHDGFQIVGVPLENGEFGFELHWNQRSVDVFLGLPFNIASYATLAKILEAMTGYKALGVEGTLKCVHIYSNQYQAVRELLKRSPFAYRNCGVRIPDINPSHDPDKVFKELSISDFNLEDYGSYSGIKVEMLAPIN
jgi:thymidylate synthase